MDGQDRKNLKKRYLVWFYKTAKEALDKVERKFTQVEIDTFLHREMLKADKDKLFRKQVDEFALYLEKKEEEGHGLKYDPDGGLKSEYAYLEARLEAVERAIRKEFGSVALQEIKGMYEAEMTQRILKSTEH